MTSPTVRVRPDVYQLDAWGEPLLWYARAIRLLQTRALDDPTGWRYQAAIHAYNRARDPYASPSDTLPSPADQQRFWNQCQHNTWYFLPWHRMYLAAFEQTIAAAVASLGGPADWSLPYWNYSDATNPDARILPPAFRDATTPDGDPNPLRVTARVVGANAGQVIADDSDVSLDALGKPVYVNAGGRVGFGGGRTGFNHSGGAGIGALEQVPHGSMHVAVGGPGGWMSAFNTAGLDPIFWLHHANIDRLWTVWKNAAPTHEDPQDPAWQTGIDFEFHDAAGNVRSYTPSQVVDTTAMPAPFTGYRYQDEGAVKTAAVFLDRSFPRSLMTDETPTETVGAAAGPTLRHLAPVTTRIAIRAPEGPTRLRAAFDAADAEPAPPPATFLHVENITGEGGPTAYEVYLNLPDGADPADHPERRAGLLPMFGVAEASAPDGEHAGEGLTYTLEVTSVVEALQAAEGWTPEDVRLTFVPRPRPTAPADDVAADALEAAAPIRVGRVSLSVG